MKFTKKNISTNLVLKWKSILYSSITPFQHIRYGCFTSKSTLLLHWATSWYFFQLKCRKWPEISSTTIGFCWHYRGGVLTWDSNYFYQNTNFLMQTFLHLRNTSSTSVMKALHKFFLFYYCHDYLSASPRLGIQNYPSRLVTIQD